MTTTTQTPATTRTCPPSAVVDMIVRWEDVKVGDLVLRDGELWPVERNEPYPTSDDLRHVALAGDIMPGCIPGDRYAAVRRYSEGLVTITAELAQTAAAGLDEAADDREYRSRPSGCPECAVLVPGDFCPEHEAHISRAIDYRQARDELMEAGR